MNFKVIPIDANISKAVRETMMSPQYKNFPAYSAVATGYGPCRSCLRTFDEGKEERIYFTYNSFDGLSNLPLPGPVFVHTEPCTEFDADDFPLELRRLPMIFEAYAENSRLALSEPVDEPNLEQQALRILASPDVEFINIRNAEAGCFIARIERA